MSKQSDFDKCLMSQLEGYRKKIHGEEFFSPRQKELFPGLKRDLNMEIEEAASSDDPLEACMERKGYKPSKTQVFQDAIAAKMTADMFGKQEKLTGAEAMFQEQMQECLDRLKNKPKIKFGDSDWYFDIDKAIQAAWESGKTFRTMYVIIPNRPGDVLRRSIKKPGVAQSFIEITPAGKVTRLDWTGATYKQTALKGKIQNKGQMTLFGKLKFGLGDKKVSKRFFKSGGGERMHVGPETPRKNSALDNLVTNIMFDLDTIKLRALYKYMEKEGIDLQTDNRQILTAQLAKAMQDKRIAGAIMNITELNKRTIPEQTDFINPSQMTLFGMITDSLPPILGWVGGKTKLASKIISMMPEHKVYVEPFLGGGSVFFKKPLADVNVINDLDKDLINFYKGVRDGNCEEIRDCKMPRNRTEFNRAVENRGTDICSYLGISKRGYGGDQNNPRFSNEIASVDIMP